MTYKIIITLIISLVWLTNIFGQDKLILEHINNPKRKKTINLDREYYIKTTDTTYKYKKIIAYSDTTLSITTMTKTDRDTTYSYTQKISKTKDTTYVYKRSIYRQDTITILFTDIQTLKKDWFKNTKWLEGFAWLSLGAIIGVAFLPVAAIDNGAEGVKEWAIFEGVFVAICAPPMFIGTRKTKYDLQNKWTIKTEK